VFPTIDPASIPETLRALERQHRCAIVLAIESGSRAWGFESADSDYDVRFIYLRQPDWYLSVLARRDVLDAQEGDFDAVGWDFRKALLLARHSHPTLQEWLQSPVVYHSVVYHSDPITVEALRAVAVQFFVPETGVYHYLGWAGRIRNRYLAADAVAYKRYLYVMRPLLCAMWLIEHRSPPPMDILHVLDGVRVSPTVAGALHSLIASKRASRELGSGPPDPVIDDFVTEQLLVLKPFGRRPAQGISTDHAQLDSIFHAALRHLWPNWHLDPPANER
jgi:uncharacterized protein